jgi:hypothetical protein
MSFASVGTGLPAAVKLDSTAFLKSLLAVLAMPSSVPAGDSSLFSVALGTAYFGPSWTAFQADRGRDFSVIVDGVSV